MIRITNSNLNCSSTSSTFFCEDDNELGGVIIFLGSGEGEGCLSLAGGVGGVGRSNQLDELVFGKLHQ